MAGPFDNRTKVMVTAVKYPNHVRIFAKGAPESLIQTCTKYLNSEGVVGQLSQQKREQIINEVVVKEFAANSLRTILTAYTDVNND